MDLINWYDTGTVSVASAGTTVTLAGGYWGDDNIMAGDLFCDPGQPLVPPQRVKQVTSNTTLELWAPWPGTAMTADPYEIRYVGIIERSTAQTRRVLEQLGDVKSWADIFVQTDADRLALESPTNPLAAKQRVLVVDDGAIWQKATSAYDDWIGPAEFKGDTGNKGWSPVHSVAVDGARRVWQLVDWVGGEGTKPAGVGKYVGPTDLVDTAAEATDVRGPAGDISGVTPFWQARITVDADAAAAREGLGAGNVVGPGSSENNRLAAFADASGKLLKDTGLTSGQVSTLVDNVSFLSGFVDKVINGDFTFWQRATSQNVSGYGSADMFYLSIGTGATVTLSRQTFTTGQADVPGNPRYFARIGRTVAGSTPTVLEHPIEDVRTLAGEKVTLTVHMKSSVAGNAELSFMQFFGSGGSPSSAVTVAPQTVALTTNWQKFSWVVTLPSMSGKTIGTTENSYLSLRISLPTALGAANVDVAHMSLRDGDFAGYSDPKPPRFIKDEEDMCLRYFEIVQGVSISSAVDVAMTLFFKVRKRTSTPTVVRTGNFYTSSEAGTLVGLQNENIIVIRNTSGIAAGGTFTVASGF